MGHGGRRVVARQLAILSNTPEAEGVLSHDADGARLLLIAGHPLGEPIVQWGPFVMNRREEIETTLADYREGRF